jgi:uncharacterized membrane protein
MAELIVIGYDDEETAAKAAAEVERLAADLIIEPESVAVLTRDMDGRYRVHTNHHPVAEGATWGMLWGALFGLIFFIPLVGFAIGGAMGALLGAFAKVGVDKQFQTEVRDMVQPGTSALFLIVDKMTSDKALEALGKFGGRVLKTSLSKDAERQLQEALYGAAATADGQSGTAADGVPAGAS